MSALDLDAAEYRRLVTNAPEPTLVADGDGTVLMASRRALDMFGYGPGEILGARIETLLDPSAGLEGGLAWISVADNGIGIAAADQDKLFQPFRRLNLRRHYDGTGLGLALARQIAEAHGGTIELESEPDRGACFSVRLPLA